MHTNRDENHSASFEASNDVLPQQEQGQKWMNKHERVQGTDLEGDAKAWSREEKNPEKKTGVREEVSGMKNSPEELLARAESSL